MAEAGQPILGERRVGSYTITVDFRLKAGAHEAFRRAIDANARASFRDEPGCRRFDVLEPKGDSERILLYEIYDDRAAFDAHVRSAHFAAFQAEVADLVSEKSVIEYDLVCEASAEQAC